MPYKYAVSFEIKSDSTYAERYASLLLELRKATDSYWDETTSFVLVQSNETIENFESRLYTKSKLISSKDKLLVIDLVHNVAVARGPFEYPHTLGSYFKGLSKK